MAEVWMCPDGRIGLRGQGNAIVLPFQDWMKIFNKIVTAPANHSWRINTETEMAMCDLCGKDEKMSYTVRYPYEICSRKL